MCTPVNRVLKFFEDADRSTLSENQSVSTPIVRTRRFQRRIIELREGTESTESGKTELRNWSFGAACENEICFTPLDPIGCPLNCIKASGTRGCDGHALPTDSELG